jgi:DNA-binding beta-propeller fold protein YncE
MVQPIGVAIDPLGQLWVANNGSNALSMFPVGANGNLPPATVIAGGMTTLSGPNGITF